MYSRVRNTHTCTGCVDAGPGESMLTHSGSAALQLVSARAGELTSGTVVVFITVALHVAVVWGKQGAAATHWTHNAGKRGLDFGHTAAEHGFVGGKMSFIQHASKNFKTTNQNPYSTNCYNFMTTLALCLQMGQNTDENEMILTISHSAFYYTTMSNDSGQFKPRSVRCENKARSHFLCSIQNQWKRAYYKYVQLRTDFFRPLS